MKILQIIPALGKGGAERLVLDICNELSRRNDTQVKLITFSDKNEYTELTKSRTWDWEVIPSNVSLSLYKPNQYNISALEKSIKAFQPDIIHTHLFKAEIISRAVYYPSAKWFSHFHSNREEFRLIKWYQMRSKQDLINTYERSYLLKQYKKNGGNHFIAISKDVYNYVKNACGLNEVTFLPNAIHYECFKFERHSFDNQELNLVSTGSLNEKKNQVFLLKVVKYLKDQLDIPVKLHLLGDGPSRQQLQDYSKELSLESDVYFHGKVDNVPAHLQKATIYVHSAKSEPFGLALIEAMATGLPVVALNAGGNKDIVKNGENGYLIESPSVEVFSEKLQSIYSDENTYWGMSKYASEFAKHFDIKDYIEELLKLYSKN